MQKGKKSTTVIFLCAFSLLRAHTKTSFIFSPHQHTRSGRKTSTQMVSRQMWDTQSSQSRDRIMRACKPVDARRSGTLFSSAIGFAGGFSSSHLAKPSPSSKSTLPHRKASRGKNSSDSTCGNLRSIFRRTG